MEVEFTSQRGTMTTSSGRNGLDLEKFTSSVTHNEDWTRLHIFLMSSTSQLLGLSQEPDDKNTSRQCYGNCTGFQSVSECGSNWPVSRTSHYLVRSLSTWRMMSSFLLIADGVSFDQPTTEHASFLGHRTDLPTETYLLLDLESGTICHHNCDTRISALDNSETC